MPSPYFVHFLVKLTLLDVMRVQYAIITRHRFEDPQELAIIVRVTFL